MTPTLPPPRPDRPGEHDVPLAAYAGRSATRAERRRVEDHLASCSECRLELRLAWLGSRMTAAAAEPLPQELHGRLMRLLPPDAHDDGRAEPVAEIPSSVRHHPPRRLVLAAATGALAAVAAGWLALGFGDGADAPAPVVIRTTADPTPQSSSGPTASGEDPGPDNSVLDAAMADYDAGRLPSGAPPIGQAPDLSRFGLQPDGATQGSLAGQAVSAYGYKSTGAAPTGRVVVYVSDRPFTSYGLRRAQYVPVEVDDAWVTWIPGPTPTLIVGASETLVHDVCENLV